VWLAILLAGAWRDDTPGLSLPVWEIALVVNDNVTSLTSSLWSDDALSGNNLSDERSLVLVYIDRNLRLIPERASLQEVLLLLTLLTASAESLESKASSSDTSNDSDNLLGVVDGLNNLCDLLGSMCGRRESSSSKSNSSESTSSSLDSLEFEAD